MSKRTKELTPSSSSANLDKAKADAEAKLKESLERSQALDALQEDAYQAALQVVVKLTCLLERALRGQCCANCWFDFGTDQWRPHGSRTTGVVGERPSSSSLGAVDEASALVSQQVLAPNAETGAGATASGSQPLVGDKGGGAEQIAFTGQVSLNDPWAHGKPRS